MPYRPKKLQPCIIPYITPFKEFRLQLIWTTNDEVSEFQQCCLGFRRVQDTQLVPQIGGVGGWVVYLFGGPHNEDYIFGVDTGAPPMILGNCHLKKCNVITHLLLQVRIYKIKASILSPPGGTAADPVSYVDNGTKYTFK